MKLQQHYNLAKKCNGRIQMAFTLLDLFQTACYRCIRHIDKKFLSPRSILRTSTQVHGLQGERQLAWAQRHEPINAFQSISLASTSEGSRIHIKSSILRIYQRSFMICQFKYNLTDHISDLRCNTHGRMKLMVERKDSCSCMGSTNYTCLAYA